MEDDYKLKKDLSGLNDSSSSKIKIKKIETNLFVKPESNILNSNNNILPVVNKDNSDMPLNKSTPAKESAEVYLKVNIVSILKDTLLERKRIFL